MTERTFADEIEPGWHIGLIKRRFKAARADRASTAKDKDAIDEAGVEKSLGDDRAALDQQGRNTADRKHSQQDIEFADFETFDASRFESGYSRSAI